MKLFRRQIVKQEQIRVDTLTRNNKVKDKLFGKEKERENYMNFAEDLYSKKIIEEGIF